jgi:hypothetical protein
MIITIQHQLENTIHRFDVKNPDSLASIEVSAICFEMNVIAILVNGKYYENK